MFTGLIEAVGTVAAVEDNNCGKELRISAPGFAENLRIGDSVAVNGCCLTIVQRDAGNLSFDLLRETLERTNLQTLASGSRVNLEGAISAGAAFGGHFVQGHIDCAAHILAVESEGADLHLAIALPAEFSRYVVHKGSVAVNGVSLTVADVSAESFAVWIIPHTSSHTNLGTMHAGDLVNLEFDLLAKYVERLLDRQIPRPA